MFSRAMWVNKMKITQAMQSLIILSCSIMLISKSASATHYYIDNVGGSDTNSGTSTSAAWKTIACVNSKMSRLVAGDIVSFKRGGTWTDLLKISKSGISGNPITFDSYGTGSKPIIRHPHSDVGEKMAIRLAASYIVIDGIMVRDTVDRGIDVRGSYNVIKNMEITNVGDGVDINGTHNLVTQSHIHDLIMVKNTSTPTYDDYGAIGVCIKNTDNEVSYNRIENCRAQSYDWGFDGGAVEIFGNGDRSYVHHNWAYRNQGFMEVGGSGTPTVSNVRVEYNIAFDTGRFTGIQNSGTFGVIPDNFKVQNNTIVETANSPITGKYDSLVFKAAGTSGQYIFRNNILYLDGLNRVASNWTTFTHDHNLFYLINGTQLNITKHSTEITGSDPQFVSLSTKNLHLKSSSPARDKGVALGYSGTVDFDGNAVPSGSAPDIGADEYVSTGTGLASSAGAPSTSQTPSHICPSDGNYTATLTVTDLSFGNASATVDTTLADTDTTAGLSIASQTGAPAPGEGGTTEPTPGSYSYSVGTTATVKPIANTDYRFSKWTGDIEESSFFSSASSLTMNNDKSVSATFCTKCADVNGDLKITPADAQYAFDIYLGKIADPTWCELENADVNSSGTKLVPKVTPADAQAIFHKYLKKGAAIGDCSGNSRTGAVSTQTAGFINAKLTLDNMTFTPDLDILVPIIIECPSEVTAFGFDLTFPSNVLTFIRLESTELTKGYALLDASVIPPYQSINYVQESAGPEGTLVLRVGGYKANPDQIPSLGVLVVLVFRSTGGFINPDATSIIATYDDLQNASVINRMVSRQDHSQNGENKRQGRNMAKGLPDKRSDF